MVKDLIIPGALIGIAADAIKLTVNYAAYLLNFTQVVFWQITATRFLDKKDLFKPVAYLIGGVADLITTSLLGIMFVYFIYYFGKRHLWLKGIGFGLFVWAGMFGTILGQSVQDKLPQSPSGIMVTIVAHLMFGLSLALLTRIFILGKLIRD